MFGNIWLSSALIVTAIFSASALYKSYSDIQEAKQIQEHYEIISDIKTLLAKQYNKNPQDITRDEIIANLPKGGNWEKVLLVDRNKDSNLSDANKEFVNEDGNFVISEDEKLKLLALKSKLKNITNVNSMIVDSSTKKYTFESGELEKNRILNDIELEKTLDRAIHILAVEILYVEGTSPSSSEIDTLLTEIVDLTPYSNMYQDFRTSSEVLSDTTLEESVLKTRKEDYFKAKMKERLARNETVVETRLYLLLKDKL